MRCKNIKCNKEHNGSFGSGVYCSRACSNSRTFSDASKLKKSLANKNQIPWSKGKKIKWVVSICKYCGNDVQHRESQQKQYHSDCWRKCAGGYREGSGHGKKGWYKGYWCDSSYELVWVIYQLEHNIPFERNTKKYEYFWKNKKRYYVPDFIQFDDIIEIKGFSNSQTLKKLDTIKNLKVLFRKDLIKEFEYVETKYGKDFIKLYDDNPYHKLTNTCKVCGKLCKSINMYCSRVCSGKANNRNSKLKLNMLG